VLGGESFVALAGQYEPAEAIQAAIAPHEKEIMGDIRNYTDITPIMQLSEVKLLAFRRRRAMRLCVIRG